MRRGKSLFRLRHQRLQPGRKARVANRRNHAALTAARRAQQPIRQRKQRHMVIYARIGDFLHRVCGRLCIHNGYARLAGADTAGGETWYAKGTAWAVENGISDGTNPEQPVTREQLAAMLYRYAGSPAVSGELSFDDTTVISIWAYDAVRWCVDNGILNGVGGNRMTPQDLARRGQVAAMLMRFLQATV